VARARGAGYSAFAMTAIDPVELAQALIRRPSVTPKDAGAMDVVQQALEAMGFQCRRLRFGEIENLYARRGTARPNLCFAGHTDVVPAGDEAAWSSGPFEGEVRGGVLYGRGAADMKGAIAAFIAAVSQALASAEPKGSISLLITGDEEGVALDGTRRVVEALQIDGEAIDHCIVGEPASSEALGDMVKIGRRGSMNAAITVEGRQGHVAYPQRAANPIRPLIGLLERLQARRLDEGYPEFQPSNLEVTTIDVGNGATNVIPARAGARLNIRFNPAHTSAGLGDWLQAEAAAAQAAFPDGRIGLELQVSGEAFLTEPGPFVALVQGACRDVLGRTPELSTTGGTSDARFICRLCPVVELGLVGKTMHGVDEQAPAQDLTDLTRLYRTLIERYFERFGG
jgi:succinyl-diaminopimelate desuccinylase